MSFLLFATKKGLVKKTVVDPYQNIRASGLIALKLTHGDELVEVRSGSGSDEIILATSRGKSIRFAETEIRESGRASLGVRGIRLKLEDAVIGMNVIKNQKVKKAQTNNSQLLVVSERGFGKRTPIQEYHRQGRGGGGIFTAKVTTKIGKIVSATLIDPNLIADLLIVSKLGQVIRLPLQSVSVLGRQTQGVKLINLIKDDQVASLTCLEKVQS